MRILRVLVLWVVLCSLGVAAIATVSASPSGGDASHVVAAQASAIDCSGLIEGGSFESPHVSEGISADGAYAPGWSGEYGVQNLADGAHDGEQVIGSTLFGVLTPTQELAIGSLPPGTVVSVAVWYRMRINGDNYPTMTVTLGSDTIQQSARFMWQVVYIRHVVQPGETTLSLTLSSDLNGLFDGVSASCVPPQTASETVSCAAVTGFINGGFSTPDLGIHDSISGAGADGWGGASLLRTGNETSDGQYVQLIAFGGLRTATQSFSSGSLPVGSVITVTFQYSGTLQVTVGTSVWGSSVAEEGWFTGNVNYVTVAENETIGMEFLALGWSAYANLDRVDGDCYCDGRADRDEHAEHGDRDEHGDPDSHADGDRDGHEHRDCSGHEHIHLNRDGYEHANRDGRKHRDRDCSGHEHIDPDPDSHADGDGDA